MVDDVELAASSSTERRGLKGRLAEQLSGHGRPASAASPSNVQTFREQ